MTTTLERLSTCENFAMYEFGRIEEALEKRASMNKTLSADADFTARWGKDEIPTSGPWDSEPDKVQWIDPTTDLDCMVIRNHYGAWCGYVGVAFGHPFFGRDYGECTLAQKCESRLYCEHSAESILAVHGGVTFSSFCDPTEAVDSICHVPAPGRADKVWWNGFDCGHAWDLSPGMSMPVNDGSIYRDLTYVVSQVESMAVQLKAQESGAEV